ncbi:hypothetical protein [Alkalitalea saponilacus]|uniref:Uncharacterized protein n=1 Tax=Alkalitalea saponilacus TaxID=889453 RepID=A0A1T5HUF6_9BACT|nr:hypothetical protein [Alkalitalea saponilacus]ASB50738.1 hypothetical protein CDL62_17065 [Alkalitalea saponilacus]SKC24313.1 hypothetical protein SAMN03080601_03614 [Alkalitalea saponilacus]
MERKMKSHKSLKIGGFSIILICLLCACDPVEEHKEEWSFNNYIGFNIDLKIYLKNGHTSDYLNLASGDSVMLFTNVIKNVGGVGAGYFLNTIDSLYLITSVPLKLGRY